MGRLNLEARAPSKSSHTSGTSSGQNKIQRRTSQQPLTRKQKFQSILLDKNFEPENPKSLEELSEDTCKWPIGHPNEENFPYCKLHVLYAFQPKGQKEDVLDKDDEVPE